MLPAGDQAKGRHLSESRLSLPTFSAATAIKFASFDTTNRLISVSRTFCRLFVDQAWRERAPETESEPVLGSSCTKGRYS